MNILYISPENTVGTLGLYRRIHEQHGNHVRYVTFFRSPKAFEEDICLNLSFNFTRPFLKKIRHKIYQFYRGEKGYHKPREGYPPVWSPEGRFDNAFLTWKEKHWDPIIQKAIETYGLYNFDVVHFESGMDFYKDARFARELKDRGVKIICHYHGEDLRSRGVLKPLDELADLNLTNEVDLLEKHPDIHYIFLPFDVKDFQARYPRDRKDNALPLVTHAPTNRYYKGSDDIIPICERLRDEGKIRFELIENKAHDVAMQMKRRSDMFIDQINDRGGWGYGMNSVESLAMGVCTLTEMNEQYCKFIQDHPFVNVNKNNLYQTLLDLASNQTLRDNYGDKGMAWVEKYHDITAVGTQLYDYYKKIGLQ
jgi:glycosyltransferase involved in cell wall biosynthesis